MWQNVWNVLYRDKATGWTIRGSNPGKSKSVFSSPKRAHQFLGLPTLLLSRYRGSFAGVMLTAHLHLVPRLRVSGVIPLLPVYAFMAGTGTTVRYLTVSVPIGAILSVQCP